MQRVIDGKRYDTEKATCVAEWENEYTRSDFKFCKKALYRTPNGRWFVAGEGGAQSEFAESAGNNSWSGGSGLYPVSSDDAKELLEIWNEVSALEEYFADQIEDA